MSDYFSKKKYKSVDTAPEESQAEKRKEQVRIDCRAEIGTKKKQKHKNAERSDSQGEKGDGQETKENEVTLNDGSAYGFGFKCKRKSRKMNEEANEGEYLLQEDEKGDEKTDSDQYCEKNVHHFEQKGSSFMQECTTKRKQKENQDKAGKKVLQGTDGSNTNDSANCFNYKSKKRKLEQVAEEHLLKEEEILKQEGRVSVKESYSEKDMNTCDVENNKGKRKKKWKEKDTERTDAYGKEVEADKNEITILNGESRSGLNCKKKKMKWKKEMKMKDEDEITEQGKSVSEFESFVPEIYYPSKNKYEMNSLQGNVESVDYHHVAVTDNLVHKKDSSRKLKHCRKLVDRDTGVYHSDKKDNEIVEEETRNHKIKKKKKRKHSEDEKSPEIQEDELVRYNLKETEAMSCDRKNYEELSITSEKCVFVNCRSTVGKERKKRGKILNKSCVSVELECKKNKRIHEQEDTETNEQKPENAIQNDTTHNVENSEEAPPTNPKQKRDFCNPSAQNSGGANTEVTGFETIDISRRNMRPSVFAQLVDPSLVRFRGSNLHKIPGYGNC